MSLFSEIEKSIERGFRRWSDKMFGAAQADELLLVHRAILEQVEGKVQTVGRGRRVFPYTRVAVTLISADADRRALYQTAFGERLEADIREALNGAGCEMPRGFGVEVETSETGDGPFEMSTGWMRRRPFTTCRRRAWWWFAVRPASGNTSWGSGV